MIIINGNELKEIILPLPVAFLLRGPHALFSNRVHMLQKEHKWLQSSNLNIAPTDQELDQVWPLPDHIHYCIQRVLPVPGRCMLQRGPPPG